MTTLFWFLKEFGLKITLDNYLLSFTKWFLGAKRIQITYMKTKPNIIIENIQWETNAFKEQFKIAYKELKMKIQEAINQSKHKRV